MTNAQLEQYAGRWLAAAPEDTTNPNEYDWALSTLSRQDLLDTGAGTSASKAFEDSVQPERSDLSRPVVVTLGNADTFHRYAVWDGAHRIASALKLGLDSIPAVVGRRKQRYDWSFARAVDGGPQYPLGLFLALPHGLQQSISYSVLTHLPLKLRTLEVSDYLEQVTAELHSLGHIVERLELTKMAAKLGNHERMGPPCIRGKGCYFGRGYMAAADLAGLTQIQAVDVDLVLSDPSVQAVLGQGIEQVR